nr:MAG TPA: hypothetical protein [Caudoviricetes sp.]
MAPRFGGVFFVTKKFIVDSSANIVICWVI